MIAAHFGALFVAGAADTVRAGIGIAGGAIDSGAARGVLDRLVSASNRSAGAEA